MHPKFKTLIPYIFIVFLLAACTFSSPDNTEQREDIPLDTMVALTVAAFPEDEIPVPTIIAMTLEAIEQAEGSGGGDQVPPATEPDQPPPPADPTATDTTLPPTATQTPTQTPTETQVPTLSPNDPKLSLGNPDWSKSFDSTGDWWLYDDDPDHKAEIKNGKLLYTMINPIGYSVWAFAAPVVEDYYLEISVEAPNVCTGKNRFGMIFQTPDAEYSEGYLLQLACDGNFRLRVWDGSNGNTLIAWGTNPAINDGPNQVNRLGIMKQGNQIGIYINGILVGEATDNSYTGSGKFGILIQSNDINNFTATFDDAAYWNLP